MLVASIERSPVLGGRVKRFNADRAKSMPGVRHVVALEPSSWIGAGGAWAAGCAAGVAGGAGSHWQAGPARRAPEVAWGGGDGGAPDSAGNPPPTPRPGRPAGTVAANTPRRPAAP